MAAQKHLCKKGSLLSVRPCRALGSCSQLHASVSPWEYHSEKQRALQPCFKAVRLEQTTEVAFLCWDFHPNQENNVVVQSHQARARGRCSGRFVCLYLGVCAWAVSLPCPGWVGGVGRNERPGKVFEDPGPSTQAQLTSLEPQHLKRLSSRPSAGVNMV